MRMRSEYTATLHSRLRRMKGLYTVELAFVAPIAFLVLFTVLEAGRAMFVYNTLEEVTRRGARLAAVCQLNDSAIAELAILGGANGYLNENGTAISNPANSFGNIEFVRVEIQSFEHELLIPGLSSAMQSFFTPRFSTTLPRESLGVTRDGLQTC